MFKRRYLGPIVVLVLFGCTGPKRADGGDAVAECGNGFVDPGEECDVGRFNADTGACKTDCTSQYCGDGFVGPDERCDDANGVDDDDCTNLCGVPILCGNAELDADEDCDDGNSSVTDDCLPSCLAASCGDGVARAGVEDCDDGVHNSDFTPDACRTICLRAFCGDQVIDKAEACDEGAANSNAASDACREDCALPTCGDGVVDTGEECDDRAFNSDDTPNACRTDCSAPSCGDGVTDSLEDCDDGAETAGCDSDCTAVVCGDGHANAQVDEDCDDAGESEACDPDCTAQSCGDGVVNQTAGEQCDVGFVYPNGTCTLGCQLACTGTYGDCGVGPGCETNLYSTQTHCGICGGDCGGGDCTVGVCEPVHLAALSEIHFTGVYTVDVHEGWLYVAARTALARVPTSATALTTPEVFPFGVTFRALAFDGDDIYYWRIGATGTTGMYRASALDSSATGVLVTAHEDVPTGLRADGQYVYFVGSVNGPEVKRFSTSTGAIELVGAVPSSTSSVPGFDFDIDAAHVYFMNFDDGELWRVNKDPSDPFPVFVGSGASTLDLAGDARWVYFPDSGAKEDQARGQGPVPLLAGAGVPGRRPRGLDVRDAPRRRRRHDPPLLDRGYAERRKACIALRRDRRDGC